MLHHHTIRKLMRKYSHRQVESDSVEIVADYLEKTIANIVSECESLLSYNGTKISRISSDTIKGVIKSENNVPLPVSTGGKGDIKRKGKKIPHLQNEVV